MFLRRGVVLALAVSVAAASHASFELLLAVDNGTNQVHRFDPVTGLSLGSFGQGMMSGPAKIAIDQTTGVAYISNFLWIRCKCGITTPRLSGDFTNSVTDPWGLCGEQRNIVIGNGASTFSSSGGFWLVRYDWLWGRM
jgi:hypothetical protein